MKKINLLSYIILLLNVCHLKAQYCTSTLGGNCATRAIADVAIANMTNTANGCTTSATSTYTDFSTNPTLTINVVAGQSYYLKVKINGTQTAKFAAWIDWNQDIEWNGAAEFYPICNTGCLNDSILITVPLTAINGATRLRVRSKNTTASNYSAGQNCSFSSTSATNGGETEDYTIVVSGGVAPPPYCLSKAKSASDDDIGIFKLDTFVNKSIIDGDSLPLFNSLATEQYSDFTSLSPIPIYAGLTLPITITQVNEDVHYPCYAKVWIDYNHDSIFQDPAELVFTSSQSLNPLVTSNGNKLNGLITIPNIAASIVDTGITRLRVVLSQQDTSDIIPCNNSGYDYGETEDYLVNIQEALACTGTPQSGTVLISNDSVCLSDIVTLSLSNSLTTSGLSFQWQSANSITGPYTNISGATSIQYLDTVGASPKFFQCIVTCANSAISTTYNPTGYFVKGFNQCYCFSGATSTSDDDIGNFTLGSFSNGTCVTPAINNPCADSTYSDFTNLGPIQLQAGLTYPISITQINSFFHYSCYAKVWIDYNRDGIFQDTTELIYTSNQSQDPSTVTNGNILTGSITVPALQPGIIDTGLTRLRVVLSEDDTSSIFQCGPYGYGETEDYSVRISSSTLCSGIPSAGTVTTSDTLICKNVSVTMNCVGSTNAAGISYQWQSASSISGPYTNVGGATSSLYISDSIIAPTYFQCVVTCSNSGSSDTTSPIFIQIKPFFNCYCNTNLGGSCGPKIINVVFNSINNPSTACAFVNNQAYTFYPDTSANLTTTLFKGTTYSLSLSTTTAGQQITAYLDFNRDGIYSNIGEKFDVLPFSSSNTQTNFTIPISIPISADTGLMGFRIRVRSGSFTNACDQLGSGETEEYFVKVDNGNVCNSLPSNINIIAIDSSVCNGQNVSLILDTLVPAIGITYAWSANGTTIPGATAISYSATQLATTIYECQVTCPGIGSVNSNPITIIQNPIDSCYCVTGLGGGCGSTSINDFSLSKKVGSLSTLTNLNNPNSGCVANSFGDEYAVYPIASGIYAEVAKTDTFIVSVTTNSSAPNQAKIWSDWNKDGIWNNTNELTTICSPCSNTTNSGQYLIDPSANLGDTVRIRVRTRGASISNACENMGSGETEDYFLVIGTNTILSVGELQSKSKTKVAIYPNPTSGILNYNLTTNAVKGQVQILDLLGRVLREETAYSTGKIDLSGLQNGNYKIVFNIDGTTIFSKVVLNK